MKRNRFVYLTLIFITIIAGLLSRKFDAQLPDIVNCYLGDCLWAMMIYWGFGFVFKSFSILKIAKISLAFCYLIEISQLYHANWIDAIRHTTLGALALGFGFLWSDIIAYTLGIGIASGMEYLISYNSVRRINTI